MDQSSLKKAFLRATWGKNRQYYDFSKYAEHILEQEANQYILNKFKKSPIFIKAKVPHLDLMSHSNSLESEVIWEFNPEVPAPNLLDLKIRRLKIEIPESHRNERKQYLLGQYQTYEASDGAIQIGDYLKTKWFIDDESTEDQWILIGIRPRLMPELEEKFLSAKVGDVINHVMDIPKNFKESQLPPKYIRMVSSFVGKNIEINIKILEAKRTLVPTPEQLVSEGKFKSVEDFEKAIDLLLELDLSELRRRYGVTQLMDSLSQVEFPIPSSISSQVTQTLSQELNFDSVESFNQIVGTNFSQDQLDLEIKSVSDRIARGEYILQTLPELIGLTQKQLDDQLLDRLLQLDLKGKNKKEIRNIFQQHRNQWCNEIILQSTLTYLESHGHMIDEEVEWEEALKLAKSDPMSLRYFTGVDLEKLS